jgi:1,2-diacylglycerol 3-alpha-glucosyltransferase
MNILMITNTFTPHVGGVARSVETFTDQYKKYGHQVLVIAPVFKDYSNNEKEIVRIPAIQHFNGSDFSFVLPIPRFLHSAIEKFKPDIIHSHHPFLLGVSALRIANLHKCPLVFTHHTFYEQYTHYVPGNSKALKRSAIQLTSSYANLCDSVFAPSQKTESVLRQRGVNVPIEVIPTGICLEHFTRGNGTQLRSTMNIPKNAFVAGYVGRLAPEKNLEFLARSLAEFLTAESRAHVLITGEGPSEKIIRKIFAHKGLSERIHFTGALRHSELRDAYQAMDVFAFASKTETQGMVLTEAMAGGIPIVALEASGTSEIVEDLHNGRLLHTENIQDFVNALQWIASLGKERIKQIKQNAMKTAENFSISKCAEKALAIYSSLIKKEHVTREKKDYEPLAITRRMIKTEWNILKGIAEVTGAAFSIGEKNIRKK